MEITTCCARGRKPQKYHNCGNTMKHGEPQTGSIGMDGAYIDGGALQGEHKYMAVAKTSPL